MLENDASNEKTQFGPSLGFKNVSGTRQIWSEIAEEQGGEFKIQMTSGNVLESHILSIPYKNWEIVLSISDSRPLKLSISFATNTDFEMIMSQEDLMDKILKKFGKQEISLGLEAFDKQYFIRSSNPGWTAAVLTRDIQNQLLEYKIFSMSYITDTKTNRAELLGVIQGISRDKEMIKGMIDMFKDLTDNLKRQKIIE